MVYSLKSVHNCFELGPLVIGELSKYYMSSGKCYSGTKVKFEAKEVSYDFLSP